VHPFGRIVRSYTQSIAAPPAVVFPLLCPVREREWLDGWDAEILSSDSGVAEEGCVFRTRPADGPETIWLIVRHDRDAGVVEFARVTAGLVATRLRLALMDRGDGSTAVEVVYTFVPLSGEGAAFVARAHSEEAFQDSMRWWERSMNHFVATGGTLRRTASG
jgi:hypothetical protein